MHLVLVIYFMGPFVLMLHNTSHRRLFKRPWSWMNHYIPWVLGPFFGESPETYFAHHVGMHHPENNLEDDLSSTMRTGATASRLPRTTSCASSSGPARAQRLPREAKAPVADDRAASSASCSSSSAVVGLLFVDWRATLVVFVLPFVIARFAMMAGNWGQHAFIDAAAPENCYRNSITCINTSYNRRCFNDGYHIGHHIKATRHWTEMPGDFEANVAEYAEEGAIVFEKLDFFGVWLCLMLGRYDWLARRYVHLGEVRPSEEEIIGLLRTRTARIRSSGRGDGSRPGRTRGPPS